MYFDVLLQCCGMLRRTLFVFWQERSHNRRYRAVSERAAYEILHLLMLPSLATLCSRCMFVSAIGIFQSVACMLSDTVDLGFSRIEGVVHTMSSVPAKSSQRACRSLHNNLSDTLKINTHPSLTTCLSCPIAPRALDVSGMLPHLDDSRL